MSTRPASSQPARLVSGTVPMPGQPRVGMRPAPVAGLHHLRIEDDVPGGEDAGGDEHPSRPGTPGGPSRAASTQLGQAIISQASGTRNGTPSSVGPRASL